MTGHSAEIEPIASWAEAHPYTWLSGVDPDGSANRPEVGQVDRVSADVAELASSGEATKSEATAKEEAAEKEGTCQHTFWTLLRAAGYETW